jgi:choline-sulfatase
VLASLRHAWCGALLALAICAFAETRWISAASVQPLNLVRSWLVAFAVMVPAALLMAVTLGLLDSVRSRLAVAKPARAEGGEAGSDAGPGLLSGLVLAVAVACSGQLALAVLSSELPPLSAAAAVALGTGLLLRSALGVALPAERWVARRFAPRLRRPAVIGLSLLALASPIVWGIATGTTNGEGGLWGLFGVFRRPELDLRGALSLLGLLTGALLGLCFRLGHGVVAALGFVLAALLFVATGARLLDDVTLAVALDRGGNLSRASVRALRAASDADRDGVSRFFGGGDCDDRRDDVFPGAVDIPGNARDEDCSGADAAAPSPKPPAQAEPEPSAALAARLPSDLNVILITVDTLRHDLGYTGYARPISAHLDRLAAESAVFERAYSLASYTGKSIGPLLIGKYPSETDRGWLHFNRFGPGERFVQERLQAARVRTISVQGHWYFTPEYGLGRGFDVLDLSAMPRERQREGDKTVNSHQISDAVIARLSQPENTGGRFFLWAHYLDPHAEYIRHAGFDFGNRGRDLYDSEVAFTDQQIGRVLDFVKSSPFASRTAIIVTSDHGEAFGEHGMYRHGFELWEALVRVPLIVFVPGAAPQRLQVRRGAIDLCPTLLELFGQPLPQGDLRLSGQSLLPDVFLPAGAMPATRPVFIDMSAGPFNEERQALIDDAGIKLIMSSGRTIGLYDLEQDPTEQRELLGDAELAKKSRAGFVAFREQLRLVHVKRR